MLFRNRHLLETAHRLGPGGRMEEPTNPVGFLSKDGVLYCSKPCAKSDGRSLGYEVDQDDYDSLIDHESVQAGGLCPACGAEFAAFSWPESEPS